MRRQVDLDASVKKKVADGGIGQNRRTPQGQHRVNEQIRISPVRLIGLNGEQMGVVPTSQAMDMAREANMDLVAVIPEFNLYDQHWPIRTRPFNAPPAKFVFAQEGSRMGLAVDSIVSPGCIISGGRVSHSVLSRLTGANKPPWPRLGARQA